MSDLAPGRWRALALVAVAELFAMTLWFSASAVVPQLTAELALDAGAQSWLTMSVQIGFVVGALASAIVNLADRVRTPMLLAGSAVVGAAFNYAIAALDLSLAPIVVLRFLTGVCLAGVYPPGMKIAASWFSRGRGVAIGVLVGALTVGSSAPHLFNALPFLGGASGQPPWRAVLATASALTLVGAIVCALFVSDGPDVARGARFDWRYAGRLFVDRPLRLANFGYLGHMWELYAMWTWVPLFLLESYRAAGIDDAFARAAGFGVVAIGGVGCVVFGVYADRVGRTTAASAAMIASGACCLIAGFSFASPLLLTAVCLFWGLTVVADSAQFSAAISELCDPSYVGTALTMQTCAGFLLTLVTIRAIPPLVEATSWGIAFATLAVGPAFGVWSMLRLRGLPEATKMASGNR